MNPSHQSPLEQFWSYLNLVLNRRISSDSNFQDVKPLSIDTGDPARLIDNHPMTNENVFFRLWVIANLAPFLGVAGADEKKRANTTVVMELCLKPILESSEGRTGKYSEVLTVHFS